MRNHQEHIEIISNSLLYILKKLGGRADFHKVFKILYFAEQKHLSKYGNTITGDTYIAMKNGPVPSDAYDIFKSVKGCGFLSSTYSNAFSKMFKVEDRYFASALVEPDMDFLSDSEVIELNASIEENRLKPFDILTQDSHDEAWAKADRDGVMDTVDIALASGASPEMIEYIKTHIENNSAVF